VVPKTSSAMKAAAKCFQERRVKKFYVAILRGHVADDKLVVDRPIGDDADSEEGVRGVIHQCLRIILNLYY
jgi:23S rRNA-/tRNA-specific pseudouridylate synthase